MQEMIATAKAEELHQMIATAKAEELHQSGAESASGVFGAGAELTASAVRVS